MSIVATVGNNLANGLSYIILGPIILISAIFSRIDDKCKQIKWLKEHSDHVNKRGAASSVRTLPDAGAGGRLSPGTLSPPKW